MEIQRLIMVLLNNKAGLHFIYICLSGLNMHYHLKKSETELWMNQVTFKRSWLSTWKVYIKVNVSMTQQLKSRKKLTSQQAQIPIIKIQQRLCLFHPHPDARIKNVLT